MSFLQREAEEMVGAWATDSFSRYIREVHQLPGLPAEIERVYFERSDRPDTSILYEEVVKHNLLLVVGVAFQYVSYGRKFGLMLNDLVQEGNIALMEAIKGFDRNRGVKFSSYAKTAVRRHIVLAIANQDIGSGRLPFYVVNNMSRVRSVWQRFEQRLGRTPTSYEVFRALCKEVRPVSGKKKLTLKQVGDTLECIGWKPPLDVAQELDHEELLTFHDVLPNHLPRPDNLLEAKEQLALLQVVIDAAEAHVKTLGPRSAGILTLRLGLFGRQVRTQLEVGKYYEISGDRVGQIEREENGRLEEVIQLSVEEFRALLQLADRLREYLTAVL